MRVNTLGPQTMARTTRTGQPGAAVRQDS
ncbi:hypothetical protein OF001_U10179 [Pseudomonas sp. OF001]|nr:hypothetical protein OF001_U10179 [Pseudomonas sp. OF001]